MVSKRGRLRRTILLVSVVPIVLLGASIALPPEPVPFHLTSLDDMVYVEGGHFLIADLQRTENLKAFYIDRFEVTESDWDRYVRESGGPQRIVFDDEPHGPDYPVRHVTQTQAVAYAAADDKTLPTNLQWERAAQGPGGSTRPWGSGFFPEAANISEFWEGPDDVRRTVMNVGTFESGKSACGAYDMIGNVWEWTADGNDRVLLRSTAGIDATEGFRSPFDAGDRFAIIRGGSFRTYIRRSNREERVENVEVKSWEIGFRCVIEESVVRFQESIAADVRLLGGRDPWRYLTQVRPATARLVDAGEEALRYLRRSHDATTSARARKRLDEIIRRIEGRSE